MFIPDFSDSGNRTADFAVSYRKTTQPNTTSAKKTEWPSRTMPNLRIPCRDSRDLIRLVQSWLDSLVEVIYCFVISCYLSAAFQEIYMSFSKRTTEVVGAFHSIAGGGKKMNYIAKLCRASSHQWPAASDLSENAFVPFLTDLDTPSCNFAQQPCRALCPHRLFGDYPMFRPCCYSQTISDHRTACPYPALALLSTTTYSSRPCPYSWGVAGRCPGMPDIIACVFSL